MRIARFPGEPDLLLSWVPVALDVAGRPEFVARYRTKGELQEHHEIATFVKEEGRWYFLDATTPAAETFVREAPKVGRNDPCPCGSGKKFKKCCLN